MSTKPHKLLESLRKGLPRLPELLIYLGVGILLLDEFLRSTFSISFLTKPAYDIRPSLAIPLIALFIYTIAHKVDKLMVAVEQSKKQYLGVIEILPPHQYLDFRELISTCKIIKLLTLSGTKAGFLGDSNVSDALADPNRKSKITILLANPYADAIKLRYESDEPDTYEAGTGGIERRLVALGSIISSLPSKKAIDVRVYDCYPTVSIIQADSDLYSTAYGYKLRGGDCPKIHSKLEGDYAKFLLKHFDKVYKSAVPLADWLAKYHPELTKV